MAVSRERILPRRHAVDVVVVGAGLAGLAAAVMLAQTGRRVTVLERDRVGGGVTGQSTGKLTALQGFTYGALYERHGVEVIQRYARGTVDAMTWLTTLIMGEGLSCDLETRLAASAVREQRFERLVEEEATAASHAGLHVGTAGGLEGLPFRIAGAVTLEHQFQLDPKSLLAELTRFALRLGVDLFEESPVTGVGADGRLRRVEVAGGRSVLAEWVVMATHVPSPDRGLLSAGYRQSRSVALAVRPADEARLPMLYMKNDGSVSSLRDYAGMVIAVGAHHETGCPPLGDPYAGLGRALATWYPGSQEAYRWSAQDAEVEDMLPVAAPASPRDGQVLAATGFRKWGISSAVAAARCLVARVEGRDHPWLAIADPWTRFRMLDLHSARGLLARQVQVAGRFVAGRFHAVGVDQGARRARIDGPPWARIATFTDPQGRRHSFHAECTHLGCEVSWNEYEESWDCPCHGSRFDSRSGEVLQGPAVLALKPAHGAGQGDEAVPRAPDEVHPGSVSPPIGASTSPL